MHLLKNIVIPLLLLILAQGLHYQWDTTPNGRYTLHENTRKLLRELEQPLKIDLFLNGKLPADYLRLQREMQTLLKSMEQQTDQLVINSVDPFEGSESTERLIEEMTRFGLPPEYSLEDQNQTVEQGVVFPWAMAVSYTHLRAHETDS